MGGGKEKMREGGRGTVTPNTNALIRLLTPALSVPVYLRLLLLLPDEATLRWCLDAWRVQVYWTGR